MADQIMHIFPHNSFADLTMYQFGMHECDPFYARGPHVRNHYLFHYVYSGKGTLSSEDDKGTVIVHEIEEGQGFMIWPNQVTSYAADGDNPWKYYWVEFNGFKARELVLESGLSLANPIYKPKDKTSQYKMIAAMRHMANNGSASPYELIGQCYLFLDAFVASSDTRKKMAHSSLQDFYVQEIMLYIESNYANDIRIEEIAAILNLDRSHVGKIFKGVMGIALRDYIVSFRVRKACELMKSPYHTIGEISAMVGYQNMYSFSRAFKSTMGKSPREWRGENRLR